MSGARDTARALGHVERRKRTKASVKYGPGHARSRCGVCTYYRVDGSCELVAGRIEPDMWCELFHRRAS